jgi:hypothetical protein
MTNYTPNYYFHCAPIILDTGSIIKKGNWGRILNLYSSQTPGDALLIYREYVLEKIRTLDYSTKPSRLNSCFVTKSLEHALIYRNFQDQRGIIYKVELTEPDAKTHIGGWNSVSPVLHQSWLQSMEGIAHDYWQGKLFPYNIQDNYQKIVEYNQLVEIVIDSDLRIIEQAG